MDIRLSEDKDLDKAQVVALYLANRWNAGLKSEQLYNGLLNSHSLITAYHGPRLIGLGNALSDGHLFVYYPHLLILPDYQGKGIGKMIMMKMHERYAHLHMQMLTADDKSIDFYVRLGFKRAGKMEPMWIYEGDEH